MPITDDRKDAWNLMFDRYEPEDEGRREALCAIGNGYFVTRAAGAEAIDDEIHYPGTYRAGVYNRHSGEIEGENIDEESIVNLPNWLPLTFRIKGGEWFSLDRVEILTYRQSLNLESGLLQRDVQFRDSHGRQTWLREQRLVSMAQPHLAGLHIELTAENWSGDLEIRSAIDGRVINDNCQSALGKQHLEPLATGAIRRTPEEVEPQGIWLMTRTCQSRIEIAVAARTRIFVQGSATKVARSLDAETAQIAERLHLNLDRGTTVAIEKIVALYTSGAPAMIESRIAAQQAIESAPDFADLRDAHCRAWQRIWQRCDFEWGESEYLRTTRLNIFHILQTISPHSIDLDVSFPSRGWHGETYRGHIFWDEMFALPFLSSCFPAIARSMLLYRYRRLDAARLLARQHGYKGAMFPWRSATTGREETPRFQFNSLSKHWLRDHTNLQHHIGAIVAYNVWQYYTITDDRAFLSDFGAELLIEIARFWASIATYNADLDRYEIRGVVGADEYHTAYPDANTPGIHNNTYTNLIAVWTICRARDAIARLSPSRCAELWQRLELSKAELDHWDTVSRKMRVIFTEDGVLSQFEGFDRLEKFDLQQFRDQHDDHPINLTLEMQGDDVNRYQVTKQADVAMLFLLLSEAEVVDLLARLGYSFDRQQMQRTIDYHLQRTAQESSLSRVVYAAALAKLDGDTSWQLFSQAHFTDLSKDSTGTKSGIHSGAMAGTLHLLRHHYLGLQIRDRALHLDPAFPKPLDRFCLNLHHQGNDLKIERVENSLSITSAIENSESVNIFCRNQLTNLQPGQSLRISLTHVEG